MTLSRPRLARYFAAMLAACGFMLVSQPAHAGQITAEVTMNKAIAEPEPTIGSVALPLVVSGLTLISVGLAGAATIRKKR